MASTKLIWRRIWGGANALFDRTRHLSWVDVLVVVSLGGLFYGLLALGRQWTGAHRATVEIDLSPWALPRYTLFSLSRGLIAYGISLGFTLVYGFWAAKDQLAERVLIPLLDILQSIPVLTFLPGVVLAMDRLFPRSNFGLELAVVLLIFTGQAWNMTFSFYHSLRSVPEDQREVATLFRFSWWQRLKWVELPFATVGLVWNSMMSMAGGWFFLTAVEQFQMPGQAVQLPGIGSYAKVAIDDGRLDAMLWAILAMIVMIVALDQLLWRPVVVWAQKFRVEESGRYETMTSWFLDWLRRSHLLALAGHVLHRWTQAREARPHKPLLARAEPARLGRLAGAVSLVGFAALLAALAYGAWQLLALLRAVSLPEWSEIGQAAALTLGRVLLTVALGTLWALPAGLAIGLSPRLSRLLQPVVQVAASFPAPMLFPLVIAGLTALSVSLGWGSIALMLLGTQWYILFNVIAGAMAIPADLQEAARSYRIGGWQRFWILYLPAVFPYLVTGWVTAAGGAWNTSIVAEYVTFKGEELHAQGLGNLITQALKEGNFPLQAASALVMATVVVLFNRTVWRRLYQLAEERFALNK